MIISHSVDFYLSKGLISLLDPGNLQIHSFKACGRCSVVRSLAFQLPMSDDLNGAGPPECPSLLADCVV